MIAALLILAGGGCSLLGGGLFAISQGYALDRDPPMARFSGGLGLFCLVLGAALFFSAGRLT